MEGFLTKRGQLIKNWKVRWFQIFEGNLRYFKDQLKSDLKGTFELHHDSTVEVSPDLGAYKCVFVVRSKDKELLVFADSTKTRQLWCDAIKSAINKHRVLKLEETNASESIAKYNESVAAKRGDAASPADESSSQHKSYFGESNSNKRSVKPARRLKTANVSTTEVPVNVFQEADFTRSGRFAPIVTPTGGGTSSQKRASNTNGYLSTCAEEEAATATANSEKQSQKASAAAVQQERYNQLKQERRRTSDSSTSSSLHAKATTAASSSSSSSKVREWKKAKAEDGEIYYYNKNTRETRWDDPYAGEGGGSVKQRHRATEGDAQDENDEEVEGDEEPAQYIPLTKEERLDQSRSEVEAVLDAWKMGENDRELSFPEMLRDLTFILSPEILEHIFTSSATGKQLFDSLAGLTTTAPPNEVKKMYLKVARFIHPDKVPKSIDPEQQMLAERVFVYVSGKYDVYRKAHGL